MKKLFLISLALIFLLSLNIISAAPKPAVSTSQSTLEIITPEWNYIKQGGDIDFYFHVYNQTKYKTNLTTNCSFHLYEENSEGEHIYILNPVTKFVGGRDFEVSINGGNFSRIGDYCYLLECQSLNEVVGLEKCFEVTKTGDILGGDLIIIFINLLFIISVIGLISTFVLTIAKLATYTETIFGVLTTWGFYILMIIVNHLADYYLLSDYVKNLSEQFLTICVWTNGVLPILALIITMILVGIKKKNVPSIQEMTGGKLYYG